MKRFAVITLGCKVNQYESDALANHLERLGWVRTPEDRPADLVIVNTCTVTGKAAMQSRQALRRAVKENPGARIAVTGCYAQTAPDDMKKISGVSLIVGHADKHRIPELIETEAGTPGTAPALVRRDIGRTTAFTAPSEAVLGSRTRQFLKIQDGCDAFCTYCIVPRARGRSRSMPVDTVLSHIRSLDAGGTREIVLTGIHLGCYGTDLSPATDLDRLLRQIETLKPASRIRLSSIEPQELSDAIIDRVAASDTFCRHFHIPLQSGDDRILEKMRRPYSAADFTARVRRIHARMPECAVGVDVLVGFPGESADAFARTRDLIASLPLAYLHVFPFSPRPGTPASRYAEPVDTETVRTRCRQLRRLGGQKRREFYERFIGCSVEMLVEDTRDPETGLLKGFSANYIPILIEGGDPLKGSRIHVRIETVDPDLAVRARVRDS